MIVEFDLLGTHLERVYFDQLSIMRQLGLAHGGRILPGMARVPHGFCLANLAVVWAALFTAWALFGSAYSSGESVLEENPDAPVALALVAAASLTPVAAS